MMLRNTLRTTLALAAIAASLALVSCQQGPRSSSLRIHNLIAATPVFIAINSSNDFYGSTQTQIMRFDPNTEGPTVLMQDISWLPNGGDGDSEADSGEFWLVIATDSNADESFDISDATTPAMKIILRDKAETTIGTIDFGQAALTTTPAVIFYYNMSIFMDDPTRVDGLHPIVVEFWEDAARTLPAGQMRFHDASLVGQMRGRVEIPTSPFAFVYWDANASGFLDTGDYYATNTIAAVPIIDGYNPPFLLSNYQIYP